MVKKILSGLVCAAVVLSFSGCERHETSTPTSVTSNEAWQNTSSSTSSVTESTKVPAESASEESKPEEPDAWADVPYASESDFMVEDVDGGVAIDLYIGYDVKVKIPEKINGKDVVKINSHIFRDYPDIQDVKVPKSVRQIGSGAFEYIEKGYYGAYSSPTLFLKRKRAENPLVIVGDIVVDGTACHGDVTIPDGVKAISPRAFFRADISNVTIPDSVVEIGAQAFSETPWMKELRSENTLVIVSDILLDVNPIGLNDITVPDNVIKIGHHAFENCDEITSITVPDSVIGIGDYAFSGCTSLANVNIPDSVTYIGDFAFSDCSNLANVTISDNVSWIGEWSFSNCVSLKSINIPNGVPKIGESAFNKCSSLVNITIPDSVTQIGRDAFANCTSLTSVALPDSITNLETVSEYTMTGPFQGCDNLTNVTYQGKNYDYEHIDFLYDIVNLGESGMQIENGVLVKVSELRELTECVIPDGVTEISNNVFNRRTSLTSVTIPNSVTRIGEYAFYKCTNLESVNISNGVSVIGECAFDECKGLMSVTIPDSITWIDQYAFSNCQNLTSVTIPGNVSHIGINVFRGCKKLASITINGSIASSTFQSLCQACGYAENNITVIYKGKTYDKEHQQELFDVIYGR